jgi:hypothetical protein
MNTRLTELTKLDNGNLKITLTDEGREELSDIVERNGNDSDAAMHDLLEFHLCNGWDNLRPEEIGALTSSGLILSDDVERSEDGETVVGCGVVYWHDNYMVENPVESLTDRGGLILTGVKQDEN